MVFLKEKIDSRLTAVQKEYKYDYDKRVRKTPAFKKSELVFVDRPPLVVKTNDSNNWTSTHEQT